MFRTHWGSCSSGSWNKCSTNTQQPQHSILLQGWPKAGFLAGSFQMKNTIHFSTFMFFCCQMNTDFQGKVHLCLLFTKILIPDIARQLEFSEASPRWQPSALYDRCTSNWDAYTLPLIWSCRSDDLACVQVIGSGALRGQWPSAICHPGHCSLLPKSIKVSW